MADIKKALYCASSQEKCLSCQTSCCCSEGPCQCSPPVLPALQARPCAAGSDAMKARDSVCACPQQCPCRKAGCANSGMDLNLCFGETGKGACCTMPGNCCCNKGSIGKL
ncbi:hypothetical protein ACOMHN_037215 [Nucella lapillus]